MNIPMNTLKRITGRAALDAYVLDGMCLGLGSGSTVELMLHELAIKIKNGLQVTTVATSSRTEALAKELSIPVMPLDKCSAIDLCIDGADEIVLHDLSMIKGGGGFLLWEKIVATIAKKMVVIVDQSKCVETLGAFPLPIEIVDFGKSHTISMICNALGVQDATIRQAENGSDFITDSGHLIVDVHCPDKLHMPSRIAESLNAIPGVVENGLFCNFAHDVFVGCMPVDGVKPYVLQGEDAADALAAAKEDSTISKA